MEHALSCNVLACRKELTGRALVTTCSHIFCLDCAQRAGATSNEPSRRLACPACASQLTKPDDAVITDLNPSEDYKTSVLSGLGPNIIMECAGRALSFWAYQTAQDICYQQYLCKTLTEKCTTLNKKLDKTVNEANSEIESLHRKFENLLGDQEALRRKHDDLVQLYKEKSRRLLQVQELYDKVKQKVQMGNIQRAASDAVDSTLFSGTDAAEAAASTFDRNKRVPTTSLESGQRPDFSEMNKGLPRSRLNQQGDTNQWAHFSLSRSGNDLGATFGDDARQRLGSQALGGVPEYPNSNSATMLNPRSFASNVQGFAPGRHRLSGLGLTSGLKVSQPTRVPSLEVVWDNGIEDPSAPRH